jgi:hypothetical protein
MADLFDFTIVTLRPGTPAAAMKRLGETLAAPGLRGKLLACWYSDIGALNQAMIIRAFSSEAALGEERRALALSADPFGLGDMAVTLASDAYAPFDFAPAPQPGKVGPVFEVRTYLCKPNGLAPTIELWRKHLPGRIKVSPMLTAMHTLGGSTPRFLHVWPYADLNTRQKTRAAAVAAGVWPPPGGSVHLLTQQSDIYFAAPFSPIQ